MSKAKVLKLVANELKAIAVATAASGESWFKSLSPKQQKEYVRLHPKSKYAQHQPRVVAVEDQRQAIK